MTTAKKIKINKQALLLVILRKVPGFKKAVKGIRKDNLTALISHLTGYRADISTIGTTVGPQNQCNI